MPEYKIFIDMIAEFLEIEPKYIQNEANLSADLGATSLDIYRIMVKAMQYFDVEISEQDLSEAETVGDAFYLLHPAV